MKRKDFFYELPEELIAQRPVKNREESRLMVLNKKSGSIEHKKFVDIFDYINAGDCLVLNDTKVIPARLYGSRLGKEEKVEFLLLKRIEGDTWETLVRPGKKARPGDKLSFGNGKLLAKVIDINVDGTRTIELEYNGIFEEILDELGEMPLPPYIKEKLKEKERYQTVYAKEKGSAAAPTAGLHFTEAILDRLQNKGVRLAFLTLHVGLGTFRPVKVENIEEHLMHAEYYKIPKETVEIINETKAQGGRIIAVGTTTTRTLETVADEKGKISPQSGWTDIFLYPGYKFKVIDGLITNFHLPESTLLMLVSALVGRENILNAYKIAVAENYRFFSFGDAMLIL